MQHKTDIEKKTFSFFWAGIVTAFIFIIWVFGTFYSFQNLDFENQAATPIEAVGNYIKSLFDGKSIYEAK